MSRTKWKALQTIELRDSILKMVRENEKVNQVMIQEQTGVKIARIRYIIKIMLEDEMIDRYMNPDDMRSSYYRIHENKLRYP